ncbi:hypothetical protein CB1_000644005 [Camelus ferus]|nr:hypothetical protein CB1_000644005 [Camelus ferus]
MPSLRGLLDTPQTLLCLRRACRGALAEPPVVSRERCPRPRTDALGHDAPPAAVCPGTACVTGPSLLQLFHYYCCKKSGAEDADEEEEAEEEEHDLCAHPRGPTCNACSSQALDGRGSLAPLTSEPCGQPCGVAASRCATCSPPYSSPFYIRTADMVPNGGGGERLSFAPMAISTDV